MYSKSSSASHSDPNIQKFVLDNGVRVIVDPVAHAHSAALVICLCGGLRDETRETVGITHLAEHMLFKRTQRKTPFDIACTIDQLGGDINAYTDADSLCLYGRVPGTSFDDLLSFFSELVLEEAFNGEDLALEQDVIRQEIHEADDSPGDAVYQKFSLEFWPQSILGLPVFGNVESVDSFTVDGVRARLRELLVGRRILVAAAGKVDPKQVVDLVNKHFGELDAGNAVEFETPTTGSGVCTVPKSVTQVYLTLGSRWPSLTHPDYRSGVVLATLLGDGMASRLFQAVREKQGLAYSVDADMDVHPDTCALLINAALEPENLARAVDVIYNEIDQLRCKGVAADEFDRTIQSLCAQLEMEADSITSRLWRALETEIYFSRYIPVEEVIANLRNIALSDVERVIGQWLTEHSWLFVMGGDVEEADVSSHIEKMCRIPC